MRNISLLFIVLFAFVGVAKAQEPAPTGKYGNVFVSVVDGVLVETGSTAKDLITFKRPEMDLLTGIHIAAAIGDEITSLRNLHNDPYEQQTGLPRYLVGRRPDAHKYILAGIIEVGVTAILAHYLKTHGPIEKWYWKGVWIIPQSVAIGLHTNAIIVGNMKP